MNDGNSLIFATLFSIQALDSHICLVTGAHSFVSKIALNNQTDKIPQKKTWTFSHAISFTDK